MIRQPDAATTSELSMVVVPAVSSGFAVAAGAISGGLFAGGLHAIAGTLKVCD